MSTKELPMATQTVDEDVDLLNEDSEADDFEHSFILNSFLLENNVQDDDRSADEEMCIISEVLADTASESGGLTPLSKDHPESDGKAKPCAATDEGASSGLNTWQGQQSPSMRKNVSSTELLAPITSADTEQRLEAQRNHSMTEINVDLRSLGDERGLVVGEEAVGTSSEEPLLPAPVSVINSEVGERQSSDSLIPRLEDLARADPLPVPELPAQAADITPESSYHSWAAMARRLSGVRPRTPISTTSRKSLLGVSLNSHISSTFPELDQFFREDHQYSARSPNPFYYPFNARSDVETWRAGRAGRLDMEIRMSGGEAQKETRNRRRPKHRVIVDDLAILVDVRNLFKEDRLEIDVDTLVRGEILIRLDTDRKEQMTDHFIMWVTEKWQKAYNYFVRLKDDMDRYKHDLDNTKDEGMRRYLLRRIATDKPWLEEAAKDLDFERIIREYRLRYQSYGLDGFITLHGEAAKHRLCEQLIKDYFGADEPTPPPVPSLSPPPSRLEVRGYRDRRLDSDGLPYKPNFTADPKKLATYRQCGRLDYKPQPRQVREHVKHYFGEDEPTPLPVPMVPESSDPSRFDEHGLWNRRLDFTADPNKFATYRQRGRLADKTQPRQVKEPENRPSRLTRIMDRISLAVTRLILH